MTAPRPYIFFALVFTVSVPFWGLGILVQGQILPRLPISALMVVVPAMVACALVVSGGGAGTLRQFLVQAFDWRAMRPWAWVIAIGTMPLAMGLSGAWLVVTGVELPPPQIDLSRTLALFALFFVAATAEELGWSGYAAGPLHARHGLLAAGAIIGLAAVAWHLIPLLQAGRSWEWIAWWSLGSISRRVIILWIYIHGGRSVFSASLFHAMSNLTWMSFPVMGSHYDPASVAVVLVGMAVLCIVQARFRAGPRHGIR